MTKLILTILFYCFLNLTFGQKDLNGTWIGKNLEYMSVNDSLVSIEFRTFKDNFQYRINNNKLILKNTYEVSSGTRDSIYFKPDSTLYHFNCKFINNDSLILKLDKVIGMNLSNPKEEYIFKRKSSLKKNNINFQSIFFRGTTCFGSCPKMRIEIDSLGNAKFKGEKYTKPFIGNYKGKLTKKQLQSLIDILNRSELERFPEKLPYLIDAPTYKFIFKYDNKEKISSGSKVPYFNHEIVKYLLNIYKEIEWTEVNYEIEFNE
jgi:hypothetical protein